MELRTGRRCVRRVNGRGWRWRKCGQEEDDALVVEEPESRLAGIYEGGCMAKAVSAEQYGPHLKYVPTGGWQGPGVKAEEKLVKTHCCFCGQQCGIQLKVRENQVVGFEPWE